MCRWKLSLLLVALALSACASGPPAHSQGHGAIATAAYDPDALPPPTQCAPFVREISGIPLRGDAWTWWDQAAGRFQRGSTPKVDSVLVLRATDQLPYGHVAIVRRVVGPREITVTHADWGSDERTRRLVHDSMPVVDVSPANDWSELRFWNAGAHAFGKVYAAYGFIYPRTTSQALRPVW